MDRETQFLELLNDCQGRWRAIARSYAGPDSEDLFQEILLQIWRSLATFRGESAGRTWCYRVALNTAMNWKRSTRTRRNRLPMHDGYSSEMLPASAPASEPIATMHQLLAEQSPADRAILLLLLDDVSYMMTFEDLRKSWQSEVARPAPSADLPQLLGKVQRDFGSLERKIHRRDIREILAAMFVLVAFGAGWPVFRMSLVASVGVAIILVSTAAIVCILISAGRPAVTPFATSVLEFSRQRLSWLDRQIRLLQTIAWWYVAPLITGCTLVGWGLTPGRWRYFGFCMLLNFFIAVVTLYVNRRAVRVDLMPLRQELVALVESLEPMSEN